MKWIRLVLLLILIFSPNFGADITISWQLKDTNIAKVNIYFETNRVKKLVKTVDSSIISTSIPIQPGIKYLIYLQSEDIFKIPSDFSNSVTYIYPISKISPIYPQFSNLLGTTSNSWKEVNIKWFVDQKYAPRSYEVHFETSHSTNIYTLKTNIFSIKNLPFNTYKIYVIGNNILGKSPVNSSNLNNITILSPQNSKKILEAEK